MQIVATGCRGPFVTNNGGEASGVAVLELIDDQGNFAHAGTYFGGISGDPKAVTALPYLSNKKPVAILTPETVSVKVGEVVEWDASESFDEDGTIVSYDWDYGDGAAAPDAMTTMDAAPMAVAGGGKSSTPCWT